MLRNVLLGLVTLWLGCMPPESDNGIADVPYPSGPYNAVLEIYALDIWAQPLADASIEVRLGGQLHSKRGPLVRLPLKDAANISVGAKQDAHQAAAISATYDGGLELTAFQADFAAGQGGQAISREVREIPHRGRTPVFTVYLGLPHKWFSASGRPARYGNQVELLTSGETAFASMKSDFASARHDILLSTWWWDSDFEMLRSEQEESATVRANQKAIAILDASVATKRLLINQFAGQDGALASLTMDSEVIYRGGQAGDNFEVLGQFNTVSSDFRFEPSLVSFADRVRGTALPTENMQDGPGLPSPMPARDVDVEPLGVSLPLASFHQKFAVVDDHVVHIGGMNFRPTDWDSAQHRIFDPRRMNPDSPAWQRAEVAAKRARPPNGARKDYSVRISGPAAADARDVFTLRWGAAIAGGAVNSEHATMPAVQAPGERMGDVTVQITTTLPAPYNEFSIGETWLNAIAQANDYIFIEDQYFRIPLLVERIVTRMNEVPTLQLVVVTKAVGAFDPGCFWTAETNAQLQAFGNRYLTVKLTTFEQDAEGNAHYDDIDVHSKMLIVDDVFMSVGSANKNNRGILYEGEMNAAIYSPRWVKEQRERIVRHLLAGDTTTAWVAAFREAAATNYGLQQRKAAPHGFIFPLTLPAQGSCATETSPDLTRHAY